MFLQKNDILILYFLDVSSQSESLETMFENECKELKDNYVYLYVSRLFRNKMKSNMYQNDLKVRVLGVISHQHKLYPIIFYIYIHIFFNKKQFLVNNRRIQPIELINAIINYLSLSGSINTISVGAYAFPRIKIGLNRFCTVFAH